MKACAQGHLDVVETLVKHDKGIIDTPDNNIQRRKKVILH